MSNYQVAEVNFEILDDIGAEGKNSDVFLIRDAALDSEMVLKRVNKADFKNADQYFDEARIIYNNQHPNVVEVNYACQDNDFIYITMPFYPKGSLSGLMKTRHLTLRQILRYSVQFLSGLHNIHSNNLLHFDLKPDNILLSDRNEAMLSDFGLAKYMDEYGFTKPEKFYVKHLPPEATFTQEFSVEFDIYQAGLTMYRMCVGSEAFNKQYERYFVGGTFDRNRFKDDLQNGIFPDRKAIPVHIHSSVKASILKCIEVDPDKRHKSALDIVNSISNVDVHYLDWQYEVNGDIQKWSKTSETNVLHCIEIAPDRTSTAYTVNSKGKRTNTTSFSSPKFTDTNLKGFLKRKL